MTFIHLKEEDIIMVVESFDQIVDAISSGNDYIFGHRFSKIEHEDDPSLHYKIAIKTDYIIHFEEGK